MFSTRRFLYKMSFLRFEFVHIIHIYMKPLNLYKLLFYVFYCDLAGNVQRKKLV